MSRRLIECAVFGRADRSKDMQPGLSAHGLGVDLGKMPRSAGRFSRIDHLSPRARPPRNSSSPRTPSEC